jgi:perosamine synthetase
MLDKFIPLASPDITDDDIACVVKVLKSGMLVQGENVLALEKSFTDYHKNEHAIAVSNGTATMHLALIALGIGPGDEVIVPAFSYVATANVVELVGATCVFVDVDLDTFTIDVTKIEAAITSKTKVIIPVHEFGLAADMEAIMKIAEKHNIIVLEDSACALGAKQNGKSTGTFGMFGSFSLHPRKSITSGEGGIILTNNAEMDKKIRQLRNHGVEMIDGNMEFVEAGFNYRMTDFQGALVNNQMQRIDTILEKKQMLASVYFNEIKNTALKLPIVPEDRNHTWQTFHILLAEEKSQKEVLAFLRAHNIGGNYGAQCIPAMKYYKAKYDLDAKQKFPNAYISYTQGIALPLYEKLTPENIKQIADIANLL